MDLADVLLLGWRGSGSSGVLLSSLLHIFVMITGHVSGFLANETGTLLHQGDSLLGGHCVYVHCVVVLLFLTILPGFEVIGVACLLRFLESPSSSVQFLTHPSKDVHSHAVLAVDSDRFLDPSIDSGWGTVEEHDLLDEGRVENRSELLDQMEVIGGGVCRVSGEGNEESELRDNLFSGLVALFQ